jgi:large subunit ribosomal protein L35
MNRPLLPNPATIFSHQNDLFKNKRLIADPRSNESTPMPCAEFASPRLISPQTAYKNLGKIIAKSDSVPIVLRPMPRSIARRKTKKSVARRFKVTATGKILRRKPGLRHLASSKSSKRKRKLGKVGQVHETMVDRIKECLPFA